MAQTTNLGGTKLEVGQAQKEATINGLFDLLDASIAGRLAISTTGGTTTLTGTPAAPQAQNLFLDVSGTLASAGIIEIPVAAGTGRNRLYVVKNGTSGAFTLTVRKVGGTGVAVTQGYTAILLYNDSDIVKILETTSGTGAFSFESAWTSWTPTWTNLTVGNGTVTAKYQQIGKTAFFRVAVVFGSTTTVDALNVMLTLPVNRAAFAGSDFHQVLGQARYKDASGNPCEGFVLATDVVSKVLPAYYSVSGSLLTGLGLSATAPFTWATGDEIHLQFNYEAA